jgi:hypothetical protein
VWESLGQADNLVTARKGGKLTIIETEETETGTKDTHADASAQARKLPRPRRRHPRRPV